jgi:DNA-directed RNA polymerase subunit RPC12/RpoP
MDHRCPLCAGNLAKRKLSQSIMAHMEIDCSHCKSRIRLNLHRAEVVVVLLSFGTFVVLAVLTYALQSQGLALIAFGTAMAGALGLPLLERTFLRSWPRYARMAA